MMVKRGFTRQLSLSEATGIHPSRVGPTLEEARSNLEEAIAPVLEANRALAAEELGGAEAIREPLTSYCAPSARQVLMPGSERVLDAGQTGPLPGEEDLYAARVGYGVIPAPGSLPE